MLARLIGEDIRLMTSGDPCVVKVDRSQLHQVIINLAVNARDAMPHGGVLEIRTSVFPLDDDCARSMGLARGEYAELVVRDTGLGMDEATLSNMFEPFFTTKAQGHGTGLGLSTVYGIVKQSGGHVIATSAPGRGTIFRLYFPITNEPVRRPEITDEAETSHLGYKGSVLLVEDDDAVRTWAEEILRGEGFKVIVARDGEEALDKMGRSSRKVDLLVTDIIMPRLGGATLAEELAERDPNLAVLYISGYPGRNLPRNLDDEPFAYLSKPFTAAQLLEKVQEALDRRVANSETKR